MEGQAFAQEQVCTWRLAGIAGTRTDWEATPFDRKHELATPGVYAYWGRPPDSSLVSVYIGQSGAFIFRLSGHRKKRLWLKYAIAIYSRESPLDQSLLRVLEVGLIRKVWQARERVAVKCKTRVDNLPTSNERFLGKERAAIAQKMLGVCCDLLGKLAIQVDRSDGEMIAACFVG